MKVQDPVATTDEGLADDAVVEHREGEIDAPLVSEELRDVVTVAAVDAPDIV